MDDISVIYAPQQQQQCNNTSNAVSTFLTELCKPNNQVHDVNDTQINMIFDGVLRFVSTRSESFSRQHFPNFKKSVENKLTSWEKIYRTTKVRDLFLAVKNGNMDTVKRLIEKEKIDPNTANPSSAESRRSLLEVALKQKTPQIPVSLYLIEKGAKLNTKIGSHESLLHYCCAYGILDIVKAIVEKKTENLNQQISSGITPLHLSTANGHYEVTEYLLQNGAGESVNVRDQVHGQTPLHIACIRLDLPTTKLLLESKAEPTRITKDELNCLQLLCSTTFSSGDNAINAKKELQVEIAKVLMAADKLITVCTDNMDNSCLHKACAIGNVKLVTLLVQSNVPVNSKNKFGRTPLWTLFESAPGPLNEVRKMIFQELINHKADVNCLLEDGTSLLHHAAKYNDIHSALALINNGLNSFIRNSWKQTPSDLALSLGFQQFVAAVEKTSTSSRKRPLDTAEETQTDTLERRPLHHAANKSIASSLPQTPHVRAGGNIYPPHARYNVHQR